MESSSYRIEISIVQLGTTSSACLCLSALIWKLFCSSVAKVIIYHLLFIMVYVNHYSSVSKKDKHDKTDHLS